MIQQNNINISSAVPLPPPEKIKELFPVSAAVTGKIAADRENIKDILSGRSDKLIAIVGPCSIHAPEEACVYAEKLAALARKTSPYLTVVMRAYFEKPRTTLGWKGLIYDPDLSGHYNITGGITAARELLGQLIAMGLPVATEMLDTIIAQYIADLVSWTAIGARTAESQLHRQLASGLSMPVGFKNATDGSIQIAIDAIKTASAPHSFIGVMENDGTVGVFETKGNPWCHVVLRGGEHPNYGAEHIAFLKVALQKAGITCGIIVDCSHANSGKDYRKQSAAFDDIIQQVMSGEKAIKGFMLESYLKEGRQTLTPGSKPAPGISITDGCIGWQETEDLLMQAAKAAKYRMENFPSGK